MGRIPIYDHAHLVFQQKTSVTFGYTDLDMSQTTLPGWLGQASTILPDDEAADPYNFLFSIPGEYLFILEYISMLADESSGRYNTRKLYINTDRNLTTSSTSNHYSMYDRLSTGHQGWTYTTHTGSWSVHNNTHFYQWVFSSSKEYSDSGYSQITPVKYVDIYKI